MNSQCQSLLSFPRIPHSSKDVVSGGMSTSINGPSSFTDRSYLLIDAVGLSLSKSLWTAVELDVVLPVVLPWAGEVARDVWAESC